MADLVVEDRLVFGEGAANQLTRWLPEAGGSVLLVTGGDSYVSSGAADQMTDILADHHVTMVAGVAPDPSVAALESVVAGLSGVRPALVVAVGGGSVIDTGKLLALLTAGDLDPVDLISTDTSSLPAVDVVAIPTTAGSGAERTHFAVVYSEGRKYSVAAASIRPVAALVDPTLTFTLPPTVTASSGLDALAHSIESMWNIHSTTETRATAARALALVWSGLSQGVDHPTPDARRDLAMGATLAGESIDVTRTTAPHALAYHLTQRFGLAHGHAVAITLGAFLEFNAAATSGDEVDPRGTDHVRQVVETICSILGVADPSAGRNAIGAVMAAAGLATSPSQFGMNSMVAREEWVESVNQERLVNNPRRVDRDGLRSLIGGLG